MINFLKEKENIMKKALALVIAVILAVFALCACGAPRAGETAIRWQQRDDRGRSR